MTIFLQLVQQILPTFLIHRSLYEVRERPSRTYSWQVLMLSNMIGEMLWAIVCAVLIYSCWYYPAGLYRNAEPTDSVAERGILMFLYLVSFMLFTTTFSHLSIAGFTKMEMAGNIVNGGFAMSLVFCGILIKPQSLGKFWIFVYRVSPLTYLVDGMLSAGLAGTRVICKQREYLRFYPPSGQTCDEYMSPFISMAGGYLQSPNTTQECHYCQIASTDAFLASSASHPDKKWRTIGLVWVYIGFNIVGAMFAYWLVRVPKNRNHGLKAKKL